MALHNKIAAGDDSDLTGIEKYVLNRLLTSKLFSRANLFRFYYDFPQISSKSDLKSSIKDAIYKSKDDIFYRTLKVMQDSAEDIWLKQDRVVRFDLSETLYGLLDKFDFQKADALALKDRDALNESLYLKIKTGYVAQYFTTCFSEQGEPFRIDRDQAEAIIASSKNVQVLARAGAGKTRALIAKILYLLEKDGQVPENLLLLSFDSDVSDNVLKKIKTDLVLNEQPEKYSSARVADTFLHFVSELSGIAAEHILINDKEAFVKIIIEDLVETDPAFKDLIYEFYKSAVDDIDRHSFKHNEDFFDYLRKVRLTTLGGEKVKQLGEKFAADFMYEYGIDYIYEQEFKIAAVKTEAEELLGFLRTGPQDTKPDFYLPSANLVWEHWSLDPQEKDISKRIEFGKLHGLPWLTYKNRLDWIHKFWEPWRQDLPDNGDPDLTFLKSVTGLIETTDVDLKPGRETFEKKCLQLFTEKGLQLRRRSKEELWKQLWARTGADFAELITSFIDRLEHRYYQDRNEFITKMAGYKDKQRISDFLKLGLKVTELYEAQLALPATKKIPLLKNFAHYECDLNQLLPLIIKKINSGAADARLKKINYIMIDEFQEFSGLYYEVYKAMLARNKEIAVFCAGDNWSAIRREAGAETTYHDDFRKFFGADAAVAHITMNFRSKRKIVVAGNHFMQNNKFHGGTAQVANPDSSECIYSEDVDKYEVADEFLQAFTQAGKHISPDRKLAAAYLQHCFEIIKKNPGKRILIEYYREMLCDVTIADFKAILTDLLLKEAVYDSEKDLNTKLWFSRIEETRGLEVDIAVILELTADVLPDHDPNDVLFQIFGEDLALNEDDQKRIFYVAISLAREQLYILTEKENRSEYIEELR